MGFVERGHQAFWLVLSLINEARGRKIVLIGHSQGACDALFLALEMIGAGYEKPKLMLYGLPSSIAGRGMRKLVKQYYPNLINYEIGRSFTQYLWILGMFVGLRKVCKPTKIKQTVKVRFVEQFVKDHLPWQLPEGSQYPELTRQFLDNLY
jgi:hypothetical protein